MRVNTDYLPHLLVGALLLFYSITVFIAGYAVGIFYSSNGFEAYVNAGLFLLFGLFLIAQLFINKKEKKVGGKDFLTLCIILWGPEICLHFIFKYLF